MWWVLLGVLGAGWVFPLIGMKKAGYPWWVFLCMAGFWFFIFVVAEPLYDWGAVSAGNSAWCGWPSWARG